MSENKIIQTGTSNIAFTDIHDSEFTIFIGKSHDYNELIEQLAAFEKLFSLTPEDKSDERLALSKKLNQQKHRIEQFKHDVLQLAEQFNRTEISADRLRRVKDSFDKGEFKEARAVLEAELEQMRDEQTRLLMKRNEYESDTLPKLKSNAEEFFLLALLTQLDYANPNWFLETCQHFERSISSYSTKHNVFQYAVFLWKHNKVSDAERYYERYLNDFESEILLEEKAAALNNLGLLHWDSNEYVRGLAECEEALTIFKKLSETDPMFLRAVAGALSNIAMFHSELDENSKAVTEYGEALTLYRELAESEPPKYLLEVAMTLSNLGSINTKLNHKQALAEVKESLKILKELVKRDSEVWFYVATAFHNLGRLYCDMKKYENGIEAYVTALDIRMELAETNPMIYLPEASCTLSNLAFVHFRFVPDRDKSIKYALETVRVLLPLYEQVPFTKGYLQTAMNVLAGWGLSNEEIDQLICSAR
jgi:tetratricopeptide (TPR) repeat protein